MQNLHIARAIGVDRQGVDLGGQIDQPGLTAWCGKPHHGSLHVKQVGGDQAAAGLGNSPFGSQHHVASARVGQNAEREGGWCLGGCRSNRWGLGSCKHHVVAVTAAQGAGGCHLQTAIGADADGTVKGFGIGQQQVATVDDLDIASPLELEKLKGGRLGLQGDGVFGHHFENIGADQARDHLHGHIIGGRGGAFGVCTGDFDLRHRTGCGTEFNTRASRCGLQRAAAQDNVAAVLAGRQRQVTGAGAQPGIAIGVDATIF